MRLAMEGLVWMAWGLGGLVAMAETPTAAPYPAASRVASRASAQQSSPEAVVVRQTSFNIPFSVPASPQAVQVQLYVSTDRGRNWRLYDQLPPGAGRFPFRAESDGEYWFALRTLDGQGRANPADPAFQPGLRIVVDTREPELQFDATVGRAGEVTCTWRVTDPTLAPRSFKIEYQEVVDGPWKEMAVQRDLPQPAPNLLVGKTTWFPDTPSRVIHVRAEAADRAGNKAAVTRRLFLAPLADRAARAGAHRAEPPPADSTAAVTHWPATPPENAGDRGSPGRPAGAPTPEAATQRTGQPVVNDAPGHPAPPSSSGRRRSVEELVSHPTYPSARSPVSPAVTRSFSPQVDSPSRTPASVDRWREVLPEGELPKMIRQTQFQLDYDIESAGPEGVAEVQLWATTDGGRTWTLWQRDEDRRSPFDVHVPDEGLYGFCIVVVANNGLCSPRPRSGDLAELWVAVDTTPPEVRLTSAVYGEGRYAGQLLIRWEARDALLGDRPVTLQFSEQPDGPWNTIATGLANTGSYYWPVDPRIPDRVYLRIEVTDGAGNTSSFQLDEPVITAGLAPRGRILRLRTG